MQEDGAIISYQPSKQRGEIQSKIQDMEQSR